MEEAGEDRMKTRRASLADGVISIRDPLHRAFGRCGGGRSRSGGLEDQPLHCTAASPRRGRFCTLALSRPRSSFGKEGRKTAAAAEKKEGRQRRAREEAAATIRFGKLPPRRRMSEGSLRGDRGLGSQGVMSPKRRTMIRGYVFYAYALGRTIHLLKATLGNQC